MADYTLEMTPGKVSPSGGLERKLSINPKSWTSQQPMFPSSYGFREGNSGMLGLLGFFTAVFPNSLMELFAPASPQTSIWLFLFVFGGLLQVYAGAKELRHGNSLTSSIFMVFGFHWIARGLTLGAPSLLASISSSGSPGIVSGDAGLFGFYYLTITILDYVFLLLTWFNPHGSLLLIITLGIVGLKLALLTVHAWVAQEAVLRAAGFFGVIGALLALYAFIADALAEDGILIWTGKFGVGVTSRKEIKAAVKSHKGD